MAGLMERQSSSPILPWTFFPLTRTKQVHKAKHTSKLSYLFFLPLSEQALSQLHLLLPLLDEVNLEDEADIWTYIWGNSISSSTCNKSMIRSANPHHSFKWLWKISCQHKHKVLFWLVLEDRSSTREILCRKTMFLPSYNCVLCSAITEETLVHLFHHCPFAKSCWQSLHLQAPADLHPYKTLRSFKGQLQVPFFMEIIILMS